MLLLQLSKKLGLTADVLKDRFYDDDFERQLTYAVAPMQRFVYPKCSTNIRLYHMNKDITDIVAFDYAFASATRIRI